MSLPPPATDAAPVKRGRPRDVGRDRAILEATLALVGEVGLAGLTIDAVALRAGVGKATIYRRWSSKEALVLDAWSALVERPELPDTGSLRDDLHGLLRTLTHTFAATGVVRRILPQMVAAAQVDDEFRVAYQQYVAQRRRPMQVILARARRRGELPPDADLELIHDLILGPFMYRVLVSGAPFDETTVDDVLAIVLAGASRTS
jgi:AcrR family transcriptional regulator